MENFRFPAMIQKLKAAPKTIVFTEGPDARIQEAAEKLLKEGLLKVILVGNVEEVNAAAQKNGFDLTGAEIDRKSVV